jgi:gluconokinase
MSLLCFDISSGGITGALLTSELRQERLAEIKWDFGDIDERAATLSIATIDTEFKRVIQQLEIPSRHGVDAVCIGSFMHNCVVLDDADRPLTPVFTWLDRRGESGVEYVRARIGDQFHERTGCRYHPMFPLFKLVSLPINRLGRVVSVKAFLVHRLTGRWVEDSGMASASGLFNIRENDWDAELLTVAKLKPENVPPIAGREEVIGAVTPAAAAEFGVPQGTPVINGSGDGFLATLGSACEVPAKLSVSLGTSAAVRQTLPKPVVDATAGTFCYRVEGRSWLLGCAGSNGGNVLDWGRNLFGRLVEGPGSTNPPIFIPLLHGERSPEWDPQLTGAWYSLTARHTGADLGLSIVEGVIFNLAHYVEIVQIASECPASDLVLSGNGFLQPISAPTLAAVTGISTWIPSDPGLATLRGAAICSLRALRQPVPSLELARVSALADPNISHRYHRYRRLRKIPVSE